MLVLLPPLVLRCINNSRPDCVKGGCSWLSGLPLFDVAALEICCYQRVFVIAFVHQNYFSSFEIKFISFPLQYICNIASFILKCSEEEEEEFETLNHLGKFVVPCSCCRRRFCLCVTNEANLYKWGSRVAREGESGCGVHIRSFIHSLAWQDKVWVFFYVLCCNCCLSSPA